jgi:hypothetical protein
MAAPEGQVARDAGIDPIPVLGDGFADPTSSAVAVAPPTADADADHEPAAGASERDPKTGKRRFWNLGKNEEPRASRSAPGSTLASPTTVAAMQSPASPSPFHHGYASPSSPGRIRSASPASSQIFERNVQEDGLGSAASPAIPSHITTENHIPPALDASTVAITDDHLDPDNVEIVTLASHQPAALTVTGGHAPELQSAAWPASAGPADDFAPHLHHDGEDTASNYGALDATDVRRLSFISFADVVHGEQAASDHASLRDSILFSGANSIASPTTAGFRSPSPLRSPISPPMTDVSGAQSPPYKGFESSPARSPRAGHSPPTGAELSIETMRQALRKTGSGDLSGARSQPLSATTEELGAGNPFR